MSARPLPILSVLEVRALAVLVEKERTVPDTYPLTLNALTAGCNQKSSRYPLMNATETEVQGAIDALKRHSLVIESSGGRVMRYAQNVKRVLEVPSQSVALLATLALRGAQTAGELRINCDRLNRFSDVSAVEGFLHEMADRPAGALVAELSRQRGARETRWVHLLSGPAPEEAVEAALAGSPAPSAPGASSRTIGTAGANASRAEVGEGAGLAGTGSASNLPPPDADALHARVAALEDEIALLSATVRQLCAELGFAYGLSPATDPQAERAALRRSEAPAAGTCPGPHETRSTGGSSY